MTASGQTLLAVGLAGAVGTLARYVVGGWLARATGGVFPWETLIINATGSLAIGALAAAMDKGALFPPVLRMALFVGFLGGYTTFSSFALEALKLGQGAQWRSAAGYVLLTNVCGLLAVWAGYAGAGSIWEAYRARMA